MAELTTLIFVDSNKLWDDCSPTNSGNVCVELYELKDVLPYQK